MFSNFVCNLQNERMTRGNKQDEAKDNNLIVGYSVVGGEGHSGRALGSIVFWTCGESRPCHQLAEIICHYFTELLNHNEWSNCATILDVCPIMTLYGEGHGEFLLFQFQAYFSP